uniref:Sua5/YciO/YrdC/YwlC family protein n=1 Tax=uncultured marine thaumarchaeote AD1000_33_B07 TaxID=1455908 RepID=A0A075FU75_9ARCH|nr:Sua5/YciO/YrdC/YwlC family protein [uncultured marine thaumarchaeote AD1000_33_B07]
MYEIKKEKTKPFPVLGVSKTELEKIAEFNTLEEKIAEKFWPGQVTLVLKVKDEKIRQSLCLDKKLLYVCLITNVFYHFLKSVNFW